MSTSIEIDAPSGEVSAQPLRFPPGFWWGAATAAYQIEGATAEDGRGPSIWDTFCAEPGRVAGGDTGARAAEHYHRYRDDVALMSELGLGAYRFSISWPRVQPGGRGAENTAGSGFYDRLVDELLTAGIKPVATLYHWDLPQELEDAGGWVNRETAYRFARYVEIIANRLGDRVQLWSTFNEPWCSAFLGYSSGGHAPGRTGTQTGLAAAHHIMLAHGLGVRVINDAVPGAQTSIVLNQGAVRPLTDDPADADAARRIDGLLNRLFLDPILRGEYPEDVLKDTAEICDWSFVQPGDLAVINTPIDVIGVNYYQPDLVSAAAEPSTEAWPFPGSESVSWHPIPGPMTEMGWYVDPTGLRDVLLRLRRDYGDVETMITENGAAFPDVPGPDGLIDDRDRIDYLRAHMAAAKEALDAGVRLRGYFVWSLMDNFEWALGYGKRFGIIHVDYDTQVRTLKASAHWYRRVIAAGGPA